MKCVSSMKSCTCKRDWSTAGGNVLRRTLLRLYYSTAALHRSVFSTGELQPNNRQEKIQILILGLPKSGKTSFCLKLCGYKDVGPIDVLAETNGFAVNTLLRFCQVYKRCFSPPTVVKYVEIKADKPVRNSEYIFARSHAVILLVDVSDDSCQCRRQSKCFVNFVTNHEFLKQKPILVVASKLDICGMPSMDKNMFMNIFHLHRLASDPKASMSIIGVELGTRQNEILEAVTDFVKVVIRNHDEISERINDDLSQMSYATTEKSMSRLKTPRDETKENSSSIQNLRTQFDAKEKEYEELSDAIQQNAPPVDLAVHCETNFHCGVGKGDERHDSLRNEKEPSRMEELDDSQHSDDNTDFTDSSDGGLEDDEEEDEEINRSSEEAFDWGKYKQEHSPANPTTHNTARMRTHIGDGQNPNDQKTRSKSLNDSLNEPSQTLPLEKFPGVENLSLIGNHEVQALSLAPTSTKFQVGGLAGDVGPNQYDSLSTAKKVKRMHSTSTK